jgi:hypothetical protein
MDFSKKQPGFLYLDKNGFYFYESSLPTVVSLAFLTTSVRDMEVVNGSSLLNQVQGFVEQYKIAPATISLILSPNISFEKDIVGLSREASKEEVEKFLDTVPFESVISKEYPIEKGIKVIGANDDMYRELKICFEKFSSTIDSVIPYQMLGQDQTYIRNLTIDSASQLLKRVDHLKQYTMLTPEQNKPQIIQASSEKKEGSQKKSGTRLYAMIGIFVVLFIILGVMIIRM